MNFYIKKNSTLPVLTVEITVDEGTTFRTTNDSFSSSTITFSMRDEDSDIYKIIDKTVTIKEKYTTGDSPFKSYFLETQFTKKETKSIGSFIGEFKIVNDSGTEILPIKEEIKISILDSFSEPDLCCRPNRGEPTINFPSETPLSTPTSTPTITPTPSLTISVTPTVSITSSVNPTPNLTPTQSITPTPSSTTGDKTIYVYYPNI